VLNERLQFKEGKLPVRYVGVPMISRKLIAHDCNQLIEKITARINSGFPKSYIFQEGCNYSPLCYTVSLFFVNRLLG
jgi:hypothetical protein